MDIQSITSLVDLGLGPLAFVALLYGGWKIICGLQTMNTNHLTHIQDGLTKMNEKMDILISHFMDEGKK
ncbi:MAG: hypothetical protein WC455_10055 [Dehalococcoidia bacterium]|jgi:hypothetical protein